jgi:predicted Zn-dependent protease with MMP-like domain
MCTSDFDQIVEGALRNIPARFRSRIDDVAMVVEDEPATSQLNASGTAFGSTLLGLYEGRPLTHPSVFEPFDVPDRIAVFQGPHERLARNGEELELWSANIPSGRAAAWSQSVRRMSRRYVGCGTFP